MGGRELIVGGREGRGEDNNNILECSWERPHRTSSVIMGTRSLNYSSSVISPTPDQGAAHYVSDGRTGQNRQERDRGGREEGRDGGRDWDRDRGKTG